MFLCCSCEEIGNGSSHVALSDGKELRMDDVSQQGAGAHNLQPDGNEIWSLLSHHVNVTLKKITNQCNKWLPHESMQIYLIEPRSL